MNQWTFPVAIVLLGFALTAQAQQRYVIERELPGAGELSATELRDIARQSNGVLEELGPDIRWIRSYVVDDKFYCVYEAENAELIRRHAEIGGFPANRISAVKTVIDPSTAK